jgi:hypothetical protein
MSELSYHPMPITTAQQWRAVGDGGGAGTTMATLGRS